MLDGLHAHVRASPCLLSTQRESYCLLSCQAPVVGRCPCPVVWVEILSAQMHTQDRDKCPGHTTDTHMKR